MQRQTTNPPRPSDRRAAETDPAFLAFAAYLEHGSLRDAWRQRSGNDQAKFAPGGWTAWSVKNDWVSRRAAYIEFTIRECQDAIQFELTKIKKRFLDSANALLDDGNIPAVLAASRIVHDHFPPVERVADVSKEERIEDLSDIPDADIDRMKEIRDAAREKNGQTPDTNLEGIPK